VYIDYTLSIRFIVYLFVLFVQPKSASYVVNQTRGISEIVTELYDTLVNKHYNLEPYYGDNPSKLQELIKEKY